VAAAEAAEALAAELATRGERVVRLGAIQAGERGVTWQPGRDTG